MIESTGIILYFLETYGQGRLRPAPDTADAMRFFQHLTFIEGSAKAPLMGLLMQLGLPADDPRRQATEAHAYRHIAVLEQAVADGGGTLVPGLFTAADIQLTFFEELMEALLPMDRWPHLQAHLAHSRTLPGYQRAEAKGGPVGIREMFGQAAAAAKAAG